MATFGQWLKTSTAAKRVTWVCGAERVLVEQVVATTRRVIGAADMDLTVLTMGPDQEREIWAAADQYSLVPDAPRLVVVRDAQKVKNWDRLKEWLDGARRYPTNYLLFVSTEHDFPYEMEDGKKAGLKPHAEWVKLRGRLVRCSMPNEKDLIAWVVARSPALDANQAMHLMQRVGGSLAAAANVCDKLAMFTRVPGTVVIDKLCDESPEDSFVDCLLAMNKPSALLALEALSPKDYGRTLGLLESRLDTVADLNREAAARPSGPRDYGRTGVPVFLAKKFGSIAARYDPAKVKRCRQALALADDAHRSGARDGVLECLTAMW